MEAKIIKENQYNARQQDTKELIHAMSVVAVDHYGKIAEPVAARFYMGKSATASVVYCAIWVDDCCSGKGTAGGGGYHKQSAALAEAIRSAGIELDTDIDGRGDTLMKEALVAITRMLGFTGEIKIISHA